MACLPGELLASVSCFQCLPSGQRDLLRLAILCRISLAITMPCDAQTLLSEAAQFQGLPPGQRELIELSLLCRLMTNGAGIGVVYSGHYGGAAPGFTPVQNAAIAYDLDAPFQMWVWNGAAWT